MCTRRVFHSMGLAIALIALLVACDDNSNADDRSTELSASLTPASSPKISGTPGAVTPTPTFRPTEELRIPQELDRQLDDTDTMRRQRQELVIKRVEPVVGDPRVIEAMQAVPRHAFVPTRYLDQAYADYPLPIGYGQTISQPSLVAMMTEMLQLEAGDHVLEIGTGSGYQAAILYQLTDNVYSIEIIPELAGIARGIFDALGYEHIHTLRADGYYGWWQYAPFDAIIVTAAPDHLPAPLVAQLDPDGGRMVIPIGPPGGYQSLWVIERHGDDVAMERVLDVAFVPFTRETGE